MKECPRERLEKLYALLDTEVLSVNRQMVAKDESFWGLVGSRSSLTELTRDRLESEVV